MVHNVSESHRRRRKRTKKPSYSASCEELSSGNKVQVREQVTYQWQAILPDGFEENLYHLLTSEMAYHPRVDCLLNKSQQVGGDDKVDAGLRDDAVFNLRFLHKFHNLSAECFALAVNATDRFLARVKVKPKYMACLATAAYLMSAKMIEDRENWPSPDRLVRIARCGGSPGDLGRMEAIIRAKLRPEAPAPSSGTPAPGSLEAAVTPLHFLVLLRPLFRGDARAYQRAVGHLETCLCSVAVYRYRPALLALCVARRYLGDSGPAAEALDSLASLLQLPAADLVLCDAAVDAEGRRVRGSRRRRHGRLSPSSDTSTPANRRQHRRLQRLQQLGAINEEMWDDSCLLDICQLFH